jgi:hypothetical protein
LNVNPLCGIHDGKRMVFSLRNLYGEQKERAVNFILLQDESRNPPSVPASMFGLVRLYKHRSDTDSLGAGIHVWLGSFLQTSIRHRFPWKEEKTMDGENGFAPCGGAAI